MMPDIDRIKKRHMMKKRDQRDELKKIGETLGVPVKELGAKSRLEEAVLDDDSRVLILEDDVVFFELDGRMLPTLRALLADVLSIPEVVVDMGAVRFVVNGADIMRPGVTNIPDGLSEGSIVAVVDERHGKPLAIGVSLMSSEEMRAASKGKVILSKHHVGDPLWEFSKN